MIVQFLDFFTYLTAVNLFHRLLFLTFKFKSDFYLNFLYFCSIIIHIPNIRVYKTLDRLYHMQTKHDILEQTDNFVSNVDHII
jgi:hypothetical protein